jgi:hypothetical protein
MTSLAQLTANRSNAQRSTGPRTEPGKAASRFNALKFGIEARSLVLPGEDPAALEALALEYHQQFNPSGPLEDYLVRTIVQADWNRRRYTRVEAQILQLLLANRGAAETPLDVFASPAAQRVSRRLAAEERSFFRALKELRCAQRERQAAEEDTETAAPAAAAAPPVPSRRPARRSCGSERALFGPRQPPNGFV